jgi:hypothetical protein
MIKVLQDNKDIFAWVASDMLGVDPEFCCHRLAIKEGAKPVAQKNRRMGQERTTAIEKQVDELLNAGFIREVQYSDWLSNVVMVKRPMESGECVQITRISTKPARRILFRCPTSISW